MQMLLLLSALGGLALAFPILKRPDEGTPVACLFGRLGVDVGTHASVDSLESPYRVTLGDQSVLNSGVGSVPDVDAFVYAGDFSADWHTHVPGGIFVELPQKDVWWYGKETEQPGPIYTVAAASTRTAGTFPVSYSTHDLVLDWEVPEYTLGTTDPGNGHDWGAVIVLNRRHLKFASDGTYNFKSLYVGYNATIEFLADAVITNGGAVELLSDEDIIFEHNVKFVGFGSPGLSLAYFSVFYAADTYSGRLTRGVEIWNAPLHNNNTLYINEIVSQGDVHIGYRQIIRGCVEANRYLNIQNYVDYRRQLP